MKNSYLYAVLKLLRFPAVEAIWHCGGSARCGASSWPVAICDGEKYKHVSWFMLVSYTYSLRFNTATDNNRQKKNTMISVEQKRKIATKFFGNRYDSFCKRPVLVRRDLSSRPVLPLWRWSVRVNGVESLAVLTGVTM